MIHDMTYGVTYDDVLMWCIIRCDCRCLMLVGWLVTYFSSSCVLSSHLMPSNHHIISSYHVIISCHHIMPSYHHIMQSYHHIISSYHAVGTHFSNSYNEDPYGYDEAGVTVETTIIIIIIIIITTYQHHHHHHHHHRP